MPEAGRITLLLAFALSLYGFAVSTAAARTARRDLAASGRRAAFALAVLFTLASGMIVYAFLVHDFRLEYVASYSSRNLGLMYRLTALWAGQNGSLLFWAWLLSLFTALAIRQQDRRDPVLLTAALPVLFAILSFFALLLLRGETDPFHVLSSPPADGRGLNPLLQNPGMVYHPPILYLGYVGFTIPFAFAIAALLTGRLDDRWITGTRGWVLFSWLALGVGNLLGAEWAYEELGWGGYWAWDPVENSSLIPWITATAFIHSVIMQKRRRMLKIWSMVLIILTFALTLFGTFVTRSGIISSVHAFAQSDIGYYFLGFLALLLLFSFGLLLSRADRLRSSLPLESLVSRESFFFFLNLLFTASAVAILWGTIYPLLSETLLGMKTAVGQSFFNRVMAPLGLVILLLTALAPVVGWRRMTAASFRRNLLLPLILAAACGLALLAAGVRRPFALGAFSLAALVVVVLAGELVRGARARREATGEPILLAAAGLLVHSRRRWGGYLVHLSVAFLFVAFAGNLFTEHYQGKLALGESMAAGRYTLTLRDRRVLEREGYSAMRMELALQRGGQEIALLHPEKRFYRSPEQVTSEVAIRTRPREDVYVILAEYDPSTATFEVLVNPLTLWLWVGGVLMILGTLLAAWPARGGRAAVAPPAPAAARLPAKGGK